MLSALFISEKISFTFAGMHSIYYSPLFNKQGSPNDDKKLEGGCQIKCVSEECQKITFTTSLLQIDLIPLGQAQG